MLLGKTGAAAKLINYEDGTKGVHGLTDEIKEILLEKHPEARPLNPEVVVPSVNAEHVEPVLFESIDSELVQKTSNKMKGSGGPTQVDADMWRSFTGSKVFNKTSTALCQAIA